MLGTKSVGRALVCGIGYVVGTRAGRERYEQIQRGAQALALQLARYVNLGPLLRRSGAADELAADALAKTPFTQLANLTGVPAMSVPLFWNAEGLPVGVQFIAPALQDERLLALAGALEAVGAVRLEMPQD